MRGADSSTAIVDNCVTVFQGLFNVLTDEPLFSLLCTLD